jgi:hypothetical protein
VVQAHGRGGVPGHCDPVSPNPEVSLAGAPRVPKGSEKVSGSARPPGVLFGSHNLARLRPRHSRGGGLETLAMRGAVNRSLG